MFYLSIHISYGQPAFQLSYTLESTSIFKIVFLTGLARLLVLTDDGYLHLLEINNSNPIQIDRICASNDDDEKDILKNVQTICLLRNNIQLLIGLKNGNICSLDLEQFSLNKQPMIPTEAIENTYVLRSKKLNRTVFFIELESTVVDESFIRVQFKQLFNIHSTMIKF